MVYRNLSNRHLIAKVMPAKQSKLWQPTWLQNDNEATVLEKLIHLPFLPRVHHHDKNLQFINNWGELDFMDVLVLDRLGSDLQQAAAEVCLADYLEAYCAALWAMMRMVEFDVVVPDPHPYNCALILDSTKLAIPCDFGDGAPATTKTLRKALKSFFAGYKRMVTSAFGAGLGSKWSVLASHIAGAEVPLSSSWVYRGSKLKWGTGATSSRGTV